MQSVCCIGFEWVQRARWKYQCRGSHPSSRESVVSFDVRSREASSEDCQNWFESMTEPTKLARPNKPATHPNKQLTSQPASRPNWPGRSNRPTNQPPVGWSVGRSVHPTHCRLVGPFILVGPASLLGRQVGWVAGRPVCQCLFGRPVWSVRPADNRSINDQIWSLWPAIL